MTPREFTTRLAFGVMFGVLVGIIDLWAFELSMKGFLAGLAAGVAYGVAIALVLAPGMDRFPVFLAGLAASAGGIGGAVWWLVARTGRLWLAICIGSLCALMQFAGEGLFSRRSAIGPS